MAGISSEYGVYLTLVFPPIISFFQAITKDMFEEALRALADEDYLTVTGKTVRLL